MNASFFVCAVDGVNDSVCGGCTDGGGVWVMVTIRGVIVLSLSVIDMVAVRVVVVVFANRVTRKVSLSLDVIDIQAEPPVDMLNTGTPKLNSVNSWFCVSWFAFHDEGSTNPSTGIVGNPPCLIGTSTDEVGPVLTTIFVVRSVVRVFSSIMALNLPSELTLERANQSTAGSSDSVALVAPLPVIVNIKSLAS